MLAIEKGRVSDESQYCIVWYKKEEPTRFVIQNEEPTTMAFHTEKCKTREIKYEVIVGDAKPRPRVIMIEYAFAADDENAGGIITVLLGGICLRNWSYLF